MVSLIFDIFNASNNNNFLYEVFGNLFEVFGNIFGSLSVGVVAFSLIYVILFFILPYFIVTFVSQKEGKIKNKKYIILIDVIFFVLFLLYSFIELNFWADRAIPLLQQNINYTEWLAYVKFIAFVNSIVYSYLINFKLLKKYLVKINLLKYQKIIFWIFMVLFILLNCYFYYLPTIYYS